jgi:GGDEF domain-containing protein
LLVRVEPTENAGSGVAASEVIDYVAEIIVKALRPTDTLLQHGDDSLVAILPNTTGRSAEALQKRLEELVAARAEAQCRWRLHVAFASTPPDDPAISQLLRIASERMLSSASVFEHREQSGRIH